MLNAVSEVSRLTNEVVQNRSVLLVGVLIGAVQRAIVEVGNAGHVRVVRGDGILYRGDLEKLSKTKQIVPSECLGRGLRFV